MPVTITQTSDSGLQTSARRPKLLMWGQPPSAVRASEARQGGRQSQKSEVLGPKSEVRGPKSSLPFHSSSAVMKNSCDELSYSTRSTFGLQQTWQSST